MAGSLNPVDHAGGRVKRQGVIREAWLGRDAGGHRESDVDLPSGAFSEQDGEQVFQRDHPGAKLRQFGLVEPQRFAAARLAGTCASAVPRKARRPRCPTSTAPVRAMARN
jgi:hypothetical protein